MLTIGSKVASSRGTISRLDIDEVIKYYLMHEVLDALAGKTMIFQTSAGTSNIPLDELDVSALRNRLEETGLDVAGSRETLVQRLQESPIEATMAK